MDSSLFDEFLKSIAEAGAICRGEIAAARTTRFSVVTARGVRDTLGLTQVQFAEMLRVSVGTLRNWEQGRREPQGPAQALLRVAQQYPEIVWKALNGTTVEARKNWQPANVVTFAQQETAVKRVHDDFSRDYVDANVSYSLGGMDEFSCATA